MRRLRREYDFRSLLLLYVLIGSVTIAASFLAPVLSTYASTAAAGTKPDSALFMLVTSNLISNVPATQLLLNLGHVPPVVAPQIAVDAGLAGNIDPIASLANFLALIIAKRAGLSIRRAVFLQLAIGAISFLPALF